MDPGQDPELGDVELDGHTGPTYREAFRLAGELLDVTTISGGYPSRYRKLHLTRERIPAEVRKRMPGRDPALVEAGIADAMAGRRPRW